MTAGGSTTSDALGGLGAATGRQRHHHSRRNQKTLAIHSASPTATPKGDTVPTSAPTVGAVPAFGDVTNTAAGVNTGLAGTITTAGAVTILHLAEPIQRLSVKSLLS